ncbi:MAG: hypothetical protein ACFE8J_04620 [Candidatus Heimdallarchaeota archaeon]
MIEPFMFLTILMIFFLFTSFITAFGYSILIHISTDFRHNQLSLRIILESFAFGLIVFICYSYFIDWIFYFDVILIFIPILLFIIFSLLLWITIDINFHSKFTIENIINKFKRLKEPEQYKYLIILAFIFVLQILIQLAIEQNLSFPFYDPFLWFKTAMSLKVNGNLDYSLVKGFSAGFFFFTTGPLTIFNNYYISYYYFKFIPIFVMFINVLVIYNISRTLFKKKVYVLFTLLVLLSFRFLFFRYLMGIPSILASCLGFIFLFSLFKDKTKFNEFNKGMIIGGIFLCHILYGIFFFIVYLLYEIWDLIRIFLIKRNRFVDQRILVNLKNFFINNGIILSIFSLLVLIYNLSLWFHGINFLSILSYTYEEFTNHSILNNNLWILNDNNQLLLDTPKLIKFLKFIANDYFNQILSIATVILFFLLFLKFEKNYKLNSNTLSFLRFLTFSFFLTTILYVVVGFLYFFEIPVFPFFINLAYMFEDRFFELFQGFWAILFTLIIKEFINYLKKKSIKYSHVDKKNDKFYQSQNKSKEFLVVLILGVILYGSNFYSIHFLAYDNYYDDEELPDVLIHAGDYFLKRENEFKNNKYNLLLFNNVVHENIFYLITFYNFLNINQSFFYNNTSFLEIEDFLNVTNADFVITPKFEVEPSAIEAIKTNYKVLYENSRFLFFQI